MSRKFFHNEIAKVFVYDPFKFRTMGIHCKAFSFSGQYLSLLSPKKITNNLANNSAIFVQCVWFSTGHTNQGRKLKIGVRILKNYQKFFY